MGVSAAFSFVVLGTAFYFVNAIHLNSIKSTLFWISSAFERIGCYDTTQTNLPLPTSILGGHPVNVASADQGRHVVSEFQQSVSKIRMSLQEVIIGQDAVIEQLLVCALTGSHALLVGAPGLAKTLMVKSLASAFSWRFNRIQFTPDLMPSDITGYELLVRDSTTGAMDMKFRHGPVFANLVLADEINRAAPKTQSALLEAMAERHVTVGGQTYQLEEPFLVIATQNPIEQEGTYPLPEAQLDRFMMEIRIGYPSPEEERKIVQRTTSEETPLPQSQFTRESFMELKRLVRSVPVPDSIADYAVKICASSRPGQNGTSSKACEQYITFGAGPRGSQNLVLAAKARALMHGRPSPTREDIAALATPILRHRIIVNHRALGDGITTDELIQKMLTEVGR
jgi:MoxR-like ATPase